MKRFPFKMARSLSEQQSIVVVTSYCYVSFGSLAVIANVAAVILLAKRPERSSFITTLLSLSSANILSGLAYILPTTMGLLASTLSMTLFDLILVRYVLVSTMLFSIFSSLFHIVIITIERLVAVLFPMRLQFWITKTRTIICLIAAWVISAIIAASPFYRFKNIKDLKSIVRADQSMIDLVFTLSIFIVAIGILMLCVYVIITYKMIKRPLLQAGRLRGSNISRQSAESHISFTPSEKKVIVNSVTVTACFILCTFPTAMTMLFLIKTIYVRVFETLIALRAFLDSIIYFFCIYYKRRDNQSKNRIQTDAATMESNT